MKRIENKTVNSHTLWLEFLKQKPNPNHSVNKSKQNGSINVENDNSKSFYKTQEEYHDENIFLKKNIASLKGENDLLKSKIRKDEEELLKKAKEMNDFIDCLENQKSGQDSSVNNFIIIKKLKQNIFHLKSEIKCKENIILSLKSDVKYTNINELKIQNETFLQEVKSLQQLILNINSKESYNGSTSYSQGCVTKIKPSKTNGKTSTARKNKELMIENKTLKKEIEKNDKTKLSLEEDNKISSSRKVDDLVVEIDRLKRACKEINQERNELQIKYDDLNSKFKILLENYEKKEAECNSLRKKGEQITSQKSESSVKSEKSTGSDNLQAQELVQIVCRAYLNREMMIENISYDNTNVDNEDLSKADILRSAFCGYASREQILNK